MKNGKSFVALVAGAALTALSMGSAFAQDKATLRLDWTTLGYHVPFFYGVAKGFYKDVGIDLKVEDGKGSSTGVNLVANQADDFAFADATTAARLIGEGLPVKVVMGVFQRSTLSIFFPKGKLSTPKDLVGKRISSCAGDGIAVYLPAYYKAINIKPTDAQSVMMDCSVKYTAVAQGQADAVASYGTAGKPLLQAVGIKEVGKFDFADAGVVLPSHGIVVSRERIKSNPDLIKRFVAASAKAWEEAIKNTDVAVASVIAARPLLKGKEASLKDAFLDSQQYIGGTPGKPFGWQSPDDWNKAVATMVEFAGMKKVDPSEVFTNEFR
jgi:NitT/TauT family transport system substrate-binding protein